MVHPPAPRIARPTRDLRRARAFWVDALGMQAQWSKPDDEHGPALLMAGFAGAGWHIEFVHDPASLTDAASGEDQLVLYLGHGPRPALIAALRAAGGRLAPGNDYWERWGTTLLDPDGYRLVLTGRTWNP